MNRPDFQFPEYQKRAQNCVRAFLKNFKPCKKSISLKIAEGNEMQVQIRVNENPPSVQIKRLPEGGFASGFQRIAEKIEANLEFENRAGLILPNSKIVVAHEEDLTRESIILTLNDSAMSAILENGLISPEQMSKTLENFKKIGPDYFVIVQRYIIGIEAADGIKVPYAIIGNSDEKTMQYLEKLPSLLC